MRRHLAALGAAVLCVFVPAAAPAVTVTPLASPAGGAPIRTLVYSFGYGVQQNTSARDSSTIDVGSANAAGGGAYASSGMSHYSGSLGDTGTMTVEVVKEQPDKGLVLYITETAKNTRNAPRAECVVYGNTSVICDPNKTVNPEEMTLLRFLGPTFVDPSIVDANHHWAVSSGGAHLTVKADYTIASNDNGMLAIDEKRTITQTGAGKLETDIQTKIDYNYNRLMPTTVDEYTTQRVEGTTSSSTTVYQTSLKLESDSLAAKP